MKARALALVSMMLWACSSFHPRRAPDAPASATYVAVDGVDLHYREWGVANKARGTVVLIHGFGSSMESWMPLPEYLGEMLHVVAFDVKGFGYSARPAGDYSPAAQARLLWRALSQLQVERTALVGHSWGASIVLAMALAEPTRLTRLGLLSAYVYDEEVPAFFRWAQLTAVGSALFRATYGSHVPERVELVYFDPRYATQARVDVVRRDAARPGAAAAALAAVMGQRFREQSLQYRTITAPTFIGWGLQDRVTPVAFAHRLAGDLPHATLRTYDRCGHLPMVEARRELAADLAAFLLPEGAAP